MKPLLIAHRGDTVHSQENTLQAFQSAIQLGADGIECDVQLINGKLKIIHDYQFNTAEEPPTLNELLLAFAQHGRIEIEVKAFSFEIISVLSKVLALHPPQDFELTTSVLFLVPELRRQFPKASLGVIFHPYEFASWMSKPFIKRKVLEVMSTLRANVAHLPSEVLDIELISSLHANGFKVHSHIMKKEIHEEVEMFARFKEMGVDQCTFDDIELLSRVKE